ncbi:hypothetical protein F511_32124 [Dorcoceras hygrometricum]|uniref:Uncharacterized protein n=1 Tax=Dorcoceras hygrometricum TaxID=472368 RepID=A0A2Z7CZ82_9LAMI|nr:hypothetical protein F511_32124 [Dorcoceras hygrometricum]
MYRYRGQIKTKLVKDKSAWWQQWTKSCSRADDKSKLEELLKRGCKREEKKRALNSSMKKPARRKDQLSANQNGDKLEDGLRSNQLR